MNSLVRTALIGNEPVSLTAMKNWLRVDPSVVNDDTDITDLITEAREQAELLTNCALVRSTFVQYLDHWPGWGAREFDYYESGGHSGGGYGGFGYDKHQRWHGEIKIKRPPLVSVQPIVFIGTDGRPYTLNPGQDFVVDIASPIGRIRPIPYTIWPLTLHVPAAIAIPFTAGYAPNTDGVAAGQTAITEPETKTSAVNPSWQPGVAVAQYSVTTDLNGNFWMQTIGPSGTTGLLAARPAFEAGAIGASIADNTASWTNVGPIRGFWQPGTQYAGLKTFLLLDFNSNLQLLNVAALISQPIPPYSLQVVGQEPLAWSTVPGGLTTDNGVAGAWICLGFYNALGDTGLAVPNSPEQQASFTADLTLPKTVSRFIKALVTHWYKNREPVTQGSLSKIPYHLEDMLGTVTVHDFNPTP